LAAYIAVWACCSSILRIVGIVGIDADADADAQRQLGQAGYPCLLAMGDQDLAQRLAASPTLSRCGSTTTNSSPP
jgi:hypothetical protein